ncbi:TPA: hypothetical protein ACT5CI_002878 [Edwardsiella tarda]
MQIGEHEGIYFSPTDEFTNEISEESLKIIIEQYRRCSRTLHYAESNAIRTLCPHSIAFAKQYKMRVDFLELILGLLLVDKSKFKEDRFFDYFDKDTEDWSVILKEKISD